MDKLRRTGVWLVVLVVLLACAMSGCKKEPDSGTDTTTEAPADANA
jgi:hypothetical protein